VRKLTTVAGRRVGSVGSVGSLEFFVMEYIQSKQEIVGAIVKPGDYA